MKVKTGLVAAVLVLAMTVTAGMASATLINIGTATYTADTWAILNTPVPDTEHDYNLFYDTVLDITWLDYRHKSGPWGGQVSWATGLNEPGVLIYNLNAEATAERWDDNDQWRLPDAGSDPGGRYIQTGYEEMGQLYYTELGNNAGGPLSNTGDFTNLLPTYYWYGTKYTGDFPSFDYPAAWFFNFDIGWQGSSWTDHNGFSAMAVLGDPIPSPTPEPATMLLLGIGLAGLAGTRLRKKRNCRAA